MPPPSAPLSVLPDYSPAAPSAPLPVLPNADPLGVPVATGSQAQWINSNTLKVGQVPVAYQAAVAVGTLLSIANDGSQAVYRVTKCIAKNYPFSVALNAFAVNLIVVYSSDPIRPVGTVIIGENTTVTGNPARPVPLTQPSYLFAYPVEANIGSIEPDYSAAAPTAPSSVLSNYTPATPTPVGDVVG